MYIRSFIVYEPQFLSQIVRVPNYLVINESLTHTAFSCKEMKQTRNEAHCLFSHGHTKCILLYHTALHAEPQCRGSQHGNPVSPEREKIVQSTCIYRVHSDKTGGRGCLS